MHAQVGLIAQPRVAVPHAPRHEWIVIAGNDENGAGGAGAFQDGEGPLGYVPGNGVIVEHIAGDEDEINPELGSLVAELLQGEKAGFANPVAGALLKPGDTQTKVQVGGVQESYHSGTSD